MFLKNCLNTRPPFINAAEDIFLSMPTVLKVDRNNLEGNSGQLKTYHSKWSNFSKSLADLLNAVHPVRLSENKIHHFSAKPFHNPSDNLSNCLCLNCPSCLKALAAIRELHDNDEELSFVTDYGASEIRQTSLKVTDGLYNRDSKVSVGENNPDDKLLVVSRVVSHVSI